MIIGDEKFLQEHEYEFSEGVGAMNQPGSPYSLSKGLHYLDS